MRSAEQENELCREFAEFVESAPVVPDRATDAAILRRTSADLRHDRWRAYTKLTLLQVAAGLLTTIICPQFGFGFGYHPTFLRDAHAAAPSLLFYLLCGLLFVSLSPILSGLVLRRNEFRQVGRKRYRYFVAYGTFAYLALVVLGTEAFVISSLAWIPGAVLGNALGFALMSRVIQRFA